MRSGGSRALDGMHTETDDGYVTELEYTHRYGPELAPSRIALACAARGLRVLHNPSPRYLEMAFGQGVSINIHAAASQLSFACIHVRAASRGVFFSTLTRLSIERGVQTIERKQ